jgi:hypothetical protein
MNLPIEIINNIAQFVDIETYNNLKLSCKVINQKVFNYELVKKRNASLVVDIYEKAITNRIKRRDMYGAFGYSFENNPDRFSCHICSKLIDNTDIIMVEYHLRICSGRLFNLDYDMSSCNDEDNNYSESSY